MYGLLMPGSNNLLPYLLRLFAGSRRELGDGQSVRARDRAAAYWQLCSEFREILSRDIPGD
jgi:hypothetical protein